MAKLVDILALELKVWPEGVSAIEQDLRGSCLYESRGPAISEYVEGMADDADTAIVTRAQWQAAVDALKADEWNGEGLPPVGTVCEFKSTQHDGPHEFESVEIMYTSKVTVVAKRLDIDRGTEEELLCHPRTAKFRPIRTPEQIAADERQKGIEELGNFLAVTSTNPAPYLWEAAQKIYDAGYRKQSKP